MGLGRGSIQHLIQPCHPSGAVKISERCPLGTVFGIEAALTYTLQSPHLW